MRDPHIHVERDQLFTHADIRRVISEATGLAVDAPKTVTTGCGRRRPYAMTSTVPERVTCLACREHAWRCRIAQAEAAESLMAIPETDPIWAVAKVTPAGLAESAREHRALAARFEVADDDAEGDKAR
jgi:hypothetical protein